MQQAHTPKAVCFGEILWDLFPGKDKTAGGAPFNVGYHLHKMGVRVHAISAIGEDELGQELIQQLDYWGMSHAGIQRHAEFPTSTVVATLDQNHEAHYEIKEGVAWDQIALTTADKQQLQDAEALIFGSLAARNTVSRNTLYALLDESNYRVFDVNIRPPFCDKDVVLALLQKAELAKFNASELDLVLGFLGKKYPDAHDGMAFLQDYFHIPELILSRGAQGATYVHEGIAIALPAAQVAVNDTVGSGDSFLAGFLSGRLLGLSADDALEQAICLSGYVTTQSGACPDYTLQHIADMKEAYRQNTADRRV